MAASAACTTACWPRWRRVSAEGAGADAGGPSLPLFPLRTVLFPGGLLPLRRLSEDHPGGEECREGTAGDAGLLGRAAHVAAQGVAASVTNRASSTVSARLRAARLQAARGQALLSVKWRKVAWQPAASQSK